jgi:hypothetical protein
LKIVLTSLLFIIVAMTSLLKVSAFWNTRFKRGYFLMMLSLRENAAEKSLLLDGTAGTAPPAKNFT